MLEPGAGKCLVDDQDLLVGETGGEWQIGDRRRGFSQNATEPVTELVLRAEDRQVSRYEIGGRLGALGSAEARGEDADGHPETAFVIQLGAGASAG